MNLTATYAAEFAQATEAGAVDPHVTNTGGGCTALEALLGDHRILATNGDACLISADDLAEMLEDGDAPEWYVGIYDTNNDEGDIQIAEGFGDDFVTALAEARESLKRGDFVAD